MPIWPSCFQEFILDLLKNKVYAEDWMLQKTIIDGVLRGESLSGIIAFFRSAGKILSHIYQGI